MPDFTPFLPLLSIVIALGAAISVVIAFIGNKNKGLSEVQSSTITALQAQNAAQDQQMQMQDKQIQTLEKKVARMESVMRTTQDMLRKRRRLRLEINGEYVTLIDERTGAEITVPIHTGPLEKREKEEI